MFFITDVNGVCIYFLISTCVHDFTSLMLQIVPLRMMCLSHGGGEGRVVAGVVVVVVDDVAGVVCVAKSVVVAVVVVLDVGVVVGAAGVVNVV